MEGQDFKFVDTHNINAFALLTSLVANWKPSEALSCRTGVSKT